MTRNRRLWIFAAIAAPTALVSSYVQQSWSTPGRLPDVANASQRAAKAELEASIREAEDGLRKLITELVALPHGGPTCVPAPPDVVIEKIAKRIAGDLGLAWPDEVVLPERDWLELHREAADVGATVAERTRQTLAEQQRLASRKLEIGDFEAVQGAVVPVPKRPMRFLQSLEGREPARFGIFEIRFGEAPELYLMRLEARLHRLDLAETFVRRVLDTRVK